MTEEQLMEIARGNVERHADWEEDATPDRIFECAYTLAIDALMDKDVSIDVAQRVATTVAQSFAQP